MINSKMQPNLVAPFGNLHFLKSDRYAYFDGTPGSVTTLKNAYALNHASIIYCCINFKHGGVQKEAAMALDRHTKRRSLAGERLAQNRTALTQTPSYQCVPHVTTHHHCDLQHQLPALASCWQHSETLTKYPNNHMKRNSAQRETQFFSTKRVLRYYPYLV